MNGIAYFLIAILGIVTTLLGAILPLISQRWSLSAVQAGQLFSWQFVSATLSTVVSAWIFRKRTFKLPILIGIALSLLGVAFLSRVDWHFGRYCIACYGVGLGLSLPALNLAVSEANRARRAASLSWLNASWAAGAVAGPLLLLVIRDLDRFLALLSIALSVCFLTSAAIPISKQGDNRFETTALRSGGLKWAMLLSSAFFLLVGSENAVSGWASSLALPQFSSAYAAAAAPAAFWTFFLASRAAAPLALRKLREAQLMACGLVCALVAIAGFFFVTNPALVLLACALAGLGIAPAVPVVIARVSENLGDHNPASTICFAFGGVGAATLPMLVGIVETKTGVLRAGLLVPLIAVSLVLIASLHIDNRRGKKRQFAMENAD